MTMLRTTCGRVNLAWDAAHRVTRHESKCRTLHGHRYSATVECSAPELDSVGRVVDFGVVKAKLGAWIDEHLDHTTIVASHDDDLWAFCVIESSEKGHRKPYRVPEGEPTAEVIAAHLFDVADQLIGDDTGLRVEVVTVWETPNCYATVRRAE